MKLEELQPNAAVRGVLSDALVTVVNAQWYGSEALELTYKDPSGRVANQLLYRHDEPRLELVEQGRPWSFDGDGALFRLVSEAHRIRLAHLFDPVLASVIHSLWEKGDKSPLILPSTIPIDDGRVQSELTRYLSENWAPIIEKDVDGASSLPLRIDSEVPNLGKLHATRRVARTIYLGSAPTTVAAHRGLEDRRVKLGCVMPGESPAIFGDALRRLAASAT